MSDDTKSEPKQKTPKGYEIPIPKEEHFERLVKKTANPTPSTTRSPKK